MSEIRSVEAVVIHADRRVDIMKLKGPFCDYAMYCHSSSMLDW